MRPRLRRQGPPLAPGDVCQDPYILTRSVGDGGASSFVDACDADSYLVGLRVWANQSIGTVQPIYQTPGGRHDGTGRGWNEGGGEPSRQPHELVARAGYAVGAIDASAATPAGRSDTNTVVAGLRVVFMRIRGDRLDPDDAYESQWVGGQGKETRLGGDGAKSSESTGAATAWSAGSA